MFSGVNPRRFNGVQAGRTRRTNIAKSSAQIPIAEASDSEQSVKQVLEFTDRRVGYARYWVPRRKRRLPRRRPRPVLNRPRKRNNDVEEEEDEICDRPHKVQNVGAAPKTIQTFREPHPRPKKQKVPWREPYTFRE